MDEEHARGLVGLPFGLELLVAGHLADSFLHRAFGLVQQALAAAHETAGDVKDAGKKVADAFKR